MAAAQDGLFPPLFGRLSPRGVPAVGIVISAGLATALLLVQVSGAPGFAAVYNLIVSLSTMAAVIPYAFCALAVGLIAGADRRTRSADRRGRVHRVRVFRVHVVRMRRDRSAVWTDAVDPRIPVYVWQRRENDAFAHTRGEAFQRHISCRYRHGSRASGPARPHWSMTSGAIRSCGCWSSCPSCLSGSDSRQMRTRCCSCCRCSPSCRWRRCSVMPLNRSRPRLATASGDCSTPHSAT